MATDIRAERLLPHGPPMDLLDQMEDIGPAHVRCTIALRPGMPYAEPGGDLPAWMGLELMAQAVAAWKTHQARAGQAPPEIGFLVAVREFTAHVPRFPCGATLEVRVRQTVNFGRMGQLEGTIHGGGALLAKATFSAYLPTPEELHALTAGRAPAGLGAGGRP